MRIVWLMLLLNLNLFAQNAGQTDELFYQANEVFAAGNHTAAQEQYEQLISEGYVGNWQLYFNLGNAYYELDQAGEAALNYHRALRIKPKNKAVLNNLEMLENKIALKAERFPLIFYKSWYRSLVNTFSGRGWLVCAVLLAWFACCAYGYWMYTGRKTEALFKGAATSLFLSLLFLFFAFTQDRYQFNENQGVLMKSEVKIKNGPSSQSKVIFSLSDGNTLTILGQGKNWYQVRFRDGREGWIERHSFEII